MAAHLCSSLVESGSGCAIRADDSYHCEDFSTLFEDAEGSMLELLTKAEKTLEKWLKEAKIG